ncbi:hypothetical protein KKB17_02890 [bacterium]|nr:hypothetical protein [bacterium]MBU1291621.1 hypothetical protein [bacterium]MBU2440247.1 hypothetical protein [bacterium]MBU4562336.1 hypothetical protein [bacterium]
MPKAFLLNLFQELPENIFVIFGIYFKLSAIFTISVLLTRFSPSKDLQKKKIKNISIKEGFLKVL